MTKKELLKKITKFSVYAVLIIISIPLLLFLALKNPKVQTLVVHEVTKILTDKLKAEISIESVDYSFFNKLRINKVYLADQKKDTLFYSSKIYVSLRGINFKNRTISVGTAEIDNGKLNLMVDSTGVINLKFIIDAFASTDTTQKSKPFNFKIRNVKLDDFHFKFHKFNTIPKPMGMNYTDLDINHIFLNIRNIRINGPKITARLENLSAHEKCGFILNQLKADVDFSPKEIRLTSATINTPDSKVNASHIIFRFNGFADWKTYVDKVRMDAQFNNSLVDFKTIAYFAPVLNKWELKGYLDGRVSGPVAALRSNNLEFTTGDSTHLALNFSIVGLPHAEQTVWRGNIQQLSTNGKEIGSLIKTFIGTQGDNVAGILSKLGEMDMNAYFSGTFSSFTSSVDLSSSIGKIAASLDTKAQNYHTNGYKLTSTLTNVDIGKIVSSPKIGKVSLTMNSEGNTNGRLILSSKTESQVQNFEFNNYNYSNTNLTLTRDGKRYSYTVATNDSNVDFICAGSYDFEASLPRTIATVNLNYLNLHKLNFMQNDSITNIRGLFNVDFTGTTIDDINGLLTINNATIYKKNTSSNIGYSTIELQNTPIHQVVISSDLASGTLKSTSPLSTLKKSLEHLGRLYFPSLYGDVAKESQPTKDTEINSYAINLKFKNIDHLLKMFIPNLSISNNTLVVGKINASTDHFDIKLISPQIVLSKNKFEKVNLQAIGTPSDLRLNVQCDKYIKNKLIVNHISLASFGQKNFINTTISFNNSTPDSKNEGTLKFRTLFESTHKQQKPIIDINIIKSLVTINDTPWSINQANIKIDSTSLDIQDFKVTNQKQKIAIAGAISENPEDQLHIIASNLDAQNFKAFLKNIGYDIQGTINGIATVKDLYKSPLLFSNITLNEAYINGRAVGNPQLISSWNDVTKQITIESSNTLNDNEVYNIKGTITPDTKDIDMNFNIARIRPFLLEPFTKGIISNMSGYLSANFTIKGKTNNPIVEGNAYLNDFKARVDFLNTYYTITAPIQITKNAFIIKKDTITDSKGHIAIVNATVTHHNLKDFKLDVSILPQDILALNTNPRLNQTFYGVGYATGLVRITGTPQDLQMNITAQTEKNTRIFIPLNNRTQVQDQSFITFVKPSTDDVDLFPIINQPQKPKSNLKLNLDLSVTPDAEAIITLDPGSGNIIKAQGTSNLNMEIDPSEGLFQMRGTYTIQKGSYRFSLLNLASKEFTINNGSTITWAGDPTKATINISATYKVRASLEPLFLGTGEGNNQRYNVDCNILISGMLMNPTIKFEIVLPDADPATNTLLQAALNTESQIQKQFVSLLMLGEFYPETTTTDNSNSSLISNAGKGMASDLLFNQLSNVVSQIVSKVDVGFNYKPVSATAAQEFELSFSTRLWNDWVTVNGNVDFADNAKSTGRGVAGNYDVEVRLDKKDRLKFKMFSNDEQDNLLNNYQTKQGVGILYQEQFNTFKDLIKRKNKKKTKDVKSPLLVPQKEENKNDSTSSNSTDE